MNNVMGLVAQPLLLLLPLQYIASNAPTAPTATAIAKHTNIFFFVRCKVWQLGLYVWILFFRFIIGAKYAKKLADRQEFAERPNNKFVRAPIIFVYDFKLCVFLYCKRENKRVRTTKIEVNSFISFSAKSNGVQ